MTRPNRQDVLARYGRVGLLLAAFSLVSGIVAAPLLKRVWSPPVAVTKNGGEPVPETVPELRPIPASLTPKQG